MPVVDIEKTNRTAPYLTIRKESRGVNELAAERFAEQIQYGFTERDSFLIIDPYFELGKEDKYRGQEVDVVLYLPVGYRVFIDESSRDYLSGVDNQEDLWSEYMAGDEWIMEDAGLKRVSVKEE